MILALLLASMFSISLVSANSMDWHSYDEGLSVSEQREQPIMVYFYTENCGACVMMEEETFTEHKVQERGDDIVFVKVDANAERGLASQYGITGVPASIFTDSEGAVIQREVGFLDADQLVTVIDEVIENYDSEDTISEPENDNNEDTTDTGITTQEEIIGEDNFFRNMLVITVSSLVVAIAIIFHLNKMKGKDNQN